MKLFLDASAMAKRYRAEPGRDTVEAKLGKADSLGLSALSMTEVLGALCRWRREGGISAAQYGDAKAQFLADWGDAQIVDLTAPVYVRAVGLLERHPLRSADALQLACALVWEPELFLSADRRQCAAARAAGLKVEELPQS